MLAVDLPEHLEALASIAWGLEPDWDAVFEGAEHSWCTEASDAIVAHFAEHGISARTVRGGLRGNWHAWVVLEDGTILDATVTQYIEGVFGHEVDEGDVPWMTEHGLADPEWYEADTALAVIEPGHAFHAEYVTDETT